MLLILCCKNAKLAVFRRLVHILQIVKKLSKKLLKFVSLFSRGSFKQVSLLLRSFIWKGSVPQLVTWFTWSFSHQCSLLKTIEIKLQQGLGSISVNHPLQQAVFATLFLARLPPPLISTTKKQTKKSIPIVENMKVWPWNRRSDGVFLLQLLVNVGIWIRRVEYQVAPSYILCAFASFG